VIASLFTLYPESVLPIWIEIPIAIWLGYMIYGRAKAASATSLAILAVLFVAGLVFAHGVFSATFLIVAGATLAGAIALSAVSTPGKRTFAFSIVGLVMLYIAIYAGSGVPLKMPEVPIAGLTLTPIVIWTIILLVYAFIASTLPVTTLLQPRDFINAEQLVVALVVLYGGLLVAHPVVVAPAVRLAPEGAPWLFPFLFITIACGAISGFHSLVSSGTSAKQLNTESDAWLVGYGGMVAEGILAVVAVLACVAGFSTRSAWMEHYATWSQAGGLGAKLGAFIQGGRLFLTHLGIPAKVAAAFLGVVIVSFAMTTIDTATRLQRYILAELGSSANVLKPLKNRYVGGAIAAGSAILLALIKGGGAGGLVLWPVFGTTNQLLAALALLVVTVWLLRQNRPTIFTLLPMVFMMVMTTFAIVLKIRGFLLDRDWLLAAVSAIIFVLAVWLVVEAALAWRRWRLQAAGRDLGQEDVPPAAGVQP
jgi:carbon starvation protein